MEKKNKERCGVDKGVQYVLNDGALHDLRESKNE